MITNEEILRVAMRQSAEDIGCSPDDFLKDSNVIVPFKLGEKAKVYYKLPIACNCISYGNNLVASVTDELSDIIKEYTKKYSFYHCFENPNMYWLNEKLAPLGYTVCFMAEYYLPDVNKVAEMPCPYEMKILEKGQFEDLYFKEWSNALCADRRQMDVLYVGAYDAGRLIGLAGCSTDAEEMWQIGIDVLPEYRKKGIATALTSKLTLEIFKRDKVSFYCTAWSNIRSVRNGIKSGFIPAWVEMTIKPIDAVKEINK